MNITFLTSGHFPYDDRIYYHMAITLAGSGHNVLIISSKADTIDKNGNISINSFNGENLSKLEKINAFRKRLEPFNPDISICSEPLPIIAAKQYRKRAGKKIKIIYDITEWYPAARFLNEYHSMGRWFGFLKLLFLNVYASMSVDAFIFGERYKSVPYRFVFPFTPHIFISYYPDLKYVDHKDALFSNKTLRLSYSGEISIAKGFGSFMKVADDLSALYPDLAIEVKLVAWHESDKDREECEFLINNVRRNISVSFPGRQKFIDFTGSINDTDIFLDLRKVNFENNFSLPIKLFYYSALGRPVIISDLKAVRRDVEIRKFGFVVKPEDTGEIIKILTGYLKNRGLYLEHCNNARRLAEKEYNWGKVTPEFLSFIESARV
jgi:glycosyltransferase involved in cell wall biosynthesis